MMKFYKVHTDLSVWNPLEIEAAMMHAMTVGNLGFNHWKKTCELYTLDRKKADNKLNWDPEVKQAIITNGDMNITTNLSVYTDVDEQLFCSSGRRGTGPKYTDDKLAELVPIFRGTILEDMHNFMQDKFGCKIRIRCQNRPVGSRPGAGLYWHTDNPVENRFHIPVWTNPGHVLLFSDKQFKWEQGFDPREAKEPMDFVGHYVPADGQVYEFFTKDYMHAVASVGVGWYQDRGLQTRCHLSFWKAIC